MSFVLNIGKEMPNPKTRVFAWPKPGFGKRQGSGKPGFITVYITAHSDFYVNRRDAVNGRQTDRPCHIAVMTLVLLCHSYCRRYAKNRDMNQL